MLLFGAALLGVVVALVWPGGGPEPPLRIPDRALTDADVEVFAKLCDQLEADRDAVRLELPHGRPMLQFATEMSRTPSRLAGTAERCGRSTAELLAIVVALAQAERVDQALAAHRKATDGREQDAALAAEIFESHGRAAPGLPEGDAPPAWWADLSERERANHSLWERVGAQVVERWAALMRPPAAAG